jgi:hypothetical protein
VRPVPHVVLVDAAPYRHSDPGCKISRMDGNKEVGFARNGRERDNLVSAVRGATCLGECW